MVIPAFLTDVTVTIAPIDDRIVEGSETVRLTISANSAYLIGASNTATVTILDNDP